MTTQNPENLKPAGNNVDTFKCRSIYLAAYFMTQYKKKLVGTEIQGGRCIFIFPLDGTEDQAIQEFTGQIIDVANISVFEFMKNVNQLKDISKPLNRNAKFSNQPRMSANGKDYRKTQI